MSRVYTSYSEEEFALISNECEQYGMTPSAFQKYCVLLYLGQNAEEIKKIDIEEMKQIMNQELNNKKSWRQIHCKCFVTTGKVVKSKSKSKNHIKPIFKEHNRKLF